MINRYRGLCLSCQSYFVFRAVVPLATTDAFRFCCPDCGIEFRARLTLDYSVPSMDIDPIGFQLDSSHELVSSPIVTVATDLPVHKTNHTKSLPEGGSPFLQMSTEMGSAFLIWRSKVEDLQQLRSEYFPLIRQLVDYLRKGNLERVQICLKELVDEVPDDDPMNTVYLCHHIMATIYAPLINQEQMVEILNEYYEHLNGCLENRSGEYKSLLEQFAADSAYRGFRAKTLATYLRILEHFDAFIVGLLYEEMPESLKNRINEFRVFRDDYSTVKALYQDIFELSSQLLVFLGAVVNLSKRGDPWSYVTGQRTYNSFTKETAFKRFKILTELPLLESLIGEVSRPMRNSIGHFNADYECSTGNLRYDDGTEMNYIEFTGELFSGIKALWVSLVVIEKFDLDMSRYGIEIPSA